MDLQTWSGSSINLLTLLSKVLFKLEVVCRPVIALSPGAFFEEEEKGPGMYCMHMCYFLGNTGNSYIPYSLNVTPDLRSWPKIDKFASFLLLLMLIATNLAIKSDRETMYEEALLTFSYMIKPAQSCPSATKIFQRP